jgi:uncharacterized protein
MLELFGWIGTFLVGFVLGLLGGGGSILIVPVLVYLFRLSAEISTSLSLLVVGLASAIGITLTPAKKEIHWPTAIAFAIPSGIGAFLARRFFVPATPNPILGLSKDAFLLVLFAALMLIISIRMIRPDKSPSPTQESPKTDFLRSTPVGLVVGTTAGYLGAGGGFLIVPALTQILRLSITAAIPTSLAIIAAQSLIGFTGAFGQPLNYPFGLMLTTVAVVGVIAGSYTKSKINPAKLKPIFGYFVLIVGVFMLIQELILK